MSSDNESIQDRLNRASKKSALAKFKRAVDLTDPEIIEKRRQRDSLVMARAEDTARGAVW